MTRPFFPSFLTEEPAWLRPVRGGSVVLRLTDETQGSVWAVISSDPVDVTTSANVCTTADLLILATVRVGPRRRWPSWPGKGAWCAAPLRERAPRRVDLPRRRWRARCRLARPLRNDLAPH